MGALLEGAGKGDSHRGMIGALQHSSQILPHETPLVQIHGVFLGGVLRFSSFAEIPGD